MLSLTLYVGLMIAVPQGSKFDPSFFVCAPDELVSLNYLKLTYFNNTISKFCISNYCLTKEIDNFGLNDPFWITNYGLPEILERQRLAYKESLSLPPFSDIDRFSQFNTNTLRQFYNFSSLYLSHCQAQLCFYKDQDHFMHRWWQVNIDCAEDLTIIYQNLLFINTSGWTQVSRRRALGKLKLVLGDDLYNSGILPPPIPLWFFEIN